MAAATVAVGETVRSALAGARVTGRHVTIPDTMDPADYEHVRQALQALGGTWSRGLGYRFAVDPRLLLAAVVAGGRVPAPDRITEGYVGTPASLARDLATRYAGLAGTRPGVRVLEPSAGDGELVAAVLAANPAADVADSCPSPLARRRRQRGTAQPAHGAAPRSSGSTQFARRTVARRAAPAPDPAPAT